jgi:hypothetical protein
VSDQLAFDFGKEYIDGHLGHTTTSGLKGIAWSYSRRSTLEHCPRRYYYAYYGSSIRTALNEPQKEKLKLLKRLSNRHERLGQILHLAVASFLKKTQMNEAWTVEGLCSWALSLFNRDIAYSMNYQRCSEAHSKYPPILLTEFYYRDQMASEQCEYARSRMLSALSNFVMSPAFSDFRDAARNQDTVVERSFKLNDCLPCKVEGRIDLAFRTESGAHIVDWKLSESVNGDESLQLISYALWGHKSFDVEPTTIQLSRCALETENVAHQILTEEALSRGRARILQDAELMLTLEKYGRAGIADAFTPCGQELLCSLCPFQEACVD